MKGEVVYLYAFDVANEIVTSQVPEILGQKPLLFEVRKDRPFPKDVPLYRPLTIEPPPLAAKVHGQTARVLIRVSPATGTWPAFIWRRANAFISNSGAPASINAWRSSTVFTAWSIPRSTNAACSGSKSSSWSFLRSSWWERSGFGNKQCER
jgi:hypothetical protein